MEPRDKARITIADEVFDLFERNGDEKYFGEDVSLLQHSLQTAALAANAGAAPHLVVAALLHDIGHLLHQLPEDIGDRGIDGRHELVGNEWLRTRFGPEVSEPVRLHVDAKRYLCAAEPDYLAILSSSSRQSLALQGDAFSSSEMERFRHTPYYEDAISLRRWDDAAKDTNARPPALRVYRFMVEMVKL